MRRGSTTRRERPAPTSSSGETPHSAATASCTACAARSGCVALSARSGRIATARRASTRLSGGPLERSHREQTREASLQLAHAPLALRREVMRHARRQLHAEHCRLRVQNRHAVRPVGHAERGAVARAEATHDSLRERARPRRVVARQHELTPRAHRARREREQRFLRRRVPVEHVHVVDDDQRRARELVQHQLGRAAPHRRRESTEKVVRGEQLGDAQWVAQRRFRRHRVREMRLARAPCRRRAGSGCRAYLAPRPQPRRQRMPPRCCGRRRIAERCSGD